MNVDGDCDVHYYMYKDVSHRSVYRKHVNVD